MTECSGITPDQGSELHDQAEEETAWDRAETDYCERGTQGCSVRHTRDSECATW